MNAADVSAMDARAAADATAKGRERTPAPLEPPLVDLGEATVERFLAHFDPLARLEAEYAAVVAQSASDNGPLNEKDASDAEGSKEACTHALGEYALLPAAPPTSSSDGGELYQPLGDASDEEDDEEDEEDSNPDSASSSRPEGAAAPTPALGSWDPATRESAMASMQRMQLAPPPWAQSAVLSDDELVALVQQRLQE